MIIKQNTSKISVGLSTLGTKEPEDKNYAIFYHDRKFINPDIYQHENFLVSDQIIRFVNLLFMVQETLLFENMSSSKPFLLKNTISVLKIRNLLAS